MENLNGVALYKFLEEKSATVRKESLRMMASGGMGHPGGSLSEIEIVVSLYYRIMRINPKIPYWEDRDRFILSKAHSSYPVYIVLAELGYYDKNEINNYGKIGSILQSHLDMNKTPGLDNSGGSLGQGLSFACGIALGAKYLKKNFTTYCLIGDGETNEGQIWEAAMSASQYKLDNLIAIIDYNKVQGKGYCYEIMNIEPIKEKWESFNWLVKEINGHDFKEIIETIDEAKYKNKIGKPTMIIAHTIKGKGVPWMEFNCEWHSKPPNYDEANRACIEIDKN
ncbi:MAG: transketolase [Actinobacteria bacterium]|nr:transketolase [Actinomycetota bacterium]